jgi:hypothetical protein
MRQIAAYGILIFFLFACSCGDGKQTAREAQGSLKEQQEGVPVIHFETLENDLGTVTEGEQLVAWFEYTNSGTAPLVIQNIRAGCGCTVPRWDDAPLAPGKSGSIRVVFNSSGKNGAQNIRVTVLSNAENPRQEIYLKAKVENKP